MLGCRGVQLISERVALRDLPMHEEPSAASRLDIAVRAASAAKVLDASAKAKCDTARGHLDSATAALAECHEQRRQKLRNCAVTLGRNAVGPLTDSDFETIRALRQQRSPTPAAQLIVRCACTLLSTDMPGTSRRRAQLLPWEEARKVLARSDLPYTVRQFNAAKLIDATELVSHVATRARWSTAVAASAPSDEQLEGLTAQMALDTSAAVGALFGWCARLLAGLKELHDAAAPSAEEEQAEAQAEASVASAKAAFNSAAAAENEAAAGYAMAEAARQEAEVCARREAEESARREAAERARAEAERARAEAERRAQQEEAERVRREAEMLAARAAEEAAAAAAAAEQRAACAAQEAAERQRAREVAEAAAAASAAAAEEEERAALAELRAVEEEIARVEEEARQAEARELAKRLAYDNFLASQRAELQRQLTAMGSDVVGASGADSARKDAAERQEVAEGDLLREAERNAIDELQQLVPQAGAERCRDALHRCNFDLSAAACELLVDLE